MRTGRAGSLLAAAVALIGAGAAAGPPAAGGGEFGVPPEERLVQAASNLSFGRWVAELRARALAQGIRGEVFDNAFAGAEHLPEVVQKDRNQSEFTKTIWDYLDSAVSEERVRNGRAAIAAHREALERIEARFGVEKEIVVAIWGLESAYGSFRGSTPTIAALATLAFDGRRATFFEGELMAALQILQAGDVGPEAMRGSWAGAMGHTQFMPSSYLRHAVDFDGDGRRDIWGEDPADALASAAAYLAGFGWTEGQPWGVEVRVPEGFDFALTGERVRKTPAEWAALGIRAVDGGTVKGEAPASILVPAGAAGAAFMIFPNFRVIERYNPADAYVIGIGYLADRISGGPPLAAGWPRQDRALTLAERHELQERLTGAGFPTGGVDGRIGPNTLAAVRDFQRAQGMIPDGYANPSLLERLR